MAGKGDVSALGFKGFLGSGVAGFPFVKLEGEMPGWMGRLPGAGKEGDRNSLPSGSGAASRGWSPFLTWVSSSVNLVTVPTVSIQLPVRDDYHAANRRRWEELLQDRELAKFPGKIETNRHGQILMMPPASGSHSRFQGRIVFHLQSLLGGESLPECPISTLNGVRAADVGWFSANRFATVKDQFVFEIAPEICVEVKSPSNTEGELAEKKLLYFEAGAEEVWICDESGGTRFYTRSDPDTARTASEICPEFPRQLL